ncbi:competence protein [Gemella sp. zg-570]|uniref:competence protein CoiA n=1 Tax=Gemella sp. zg-570 TaxID=2840371 RepID=UPI001C0D33BF|nr:competence protein CoiA family protein [Gemella sp. zg-570]QWQ38702.1 competence protein [Gemella sp. zg-570]
MYIVYDKNNKICNAIDEEINRRDKYYCPLCKSEVIFKKGSKIQSHFAHVKNSECSFENYKKESKEHLEVKKKLYQHFKNKYKNVQVEYIFKTNDSLQIADLYLADKNIALEYQRSIIPYTLLADRTRGYLDAGIKLIWLIDVNKFVKEIKRNNDIVYIKYSPFVDNFLNYHKGAIFFYGFDRNRDEILFYQLWASSLKKHNAICKISSCKLSNFDLPLNFTFSSKNLTTKFYPTDIENYVYRQLKFDKTVKNKLLSLFYNQRIALNKIPKIIGLNLNEQLLLRSPLIMWQGQMFKLYKQGKSYQEILKYMLNYITFIDTIYINDYEKLRILKKIIDWYYTKLQN